MTFSSPFLSFFSFFFARKFVIVALFSLFCFVWSVLFSLLFGALLLFNFCCFCGFHRNDILIVLFFFVFQICIARSLAHSLDSPSLISTLFSLENKSIFSPRFNSAPFLSHSNRNLCVFQILDGNFFLRIYSVVGI